MLWPLELRPIHYTVLWNFFPQKFPSSHFPLSTLHHFHFPIDIPSELAPWHHSLCSKIEPGLRSESVFEEQHLIEALNQAWIFTGESTFPSLCPYLSLPFPVAILYPRCSKSLSPSPFSMSLIWFGFFVGCERGVFDLKYWCWLWLVRHVDWILLIWIFRENLYYLTLIP